MKKHDLQSLVIECLCENLGENPFTSKKQSNKEHIMKKSELKQLVNEVVRQCINEAGPQYKVVGRKSTLEQPGLRNKAREMQSDEEINEIFPPEGSSEDQTPDMNTGTDFDSTAVEEPQDYEESEEIELLKQMAMILLQLLKMHKGEETGDEEPELAQEPEIPGIPGEEEPANTGSPFGGPPKSPAAPKKSSFPSKKDDGEKKRPTEKTPEKKKKDEVDESNFKVQARSYKTVKDLPNKPKETRNPKNPMT